MQNVAKCFEIVFRSLSAQWSEWCDTRYALRKLYKNRDFKQADLELTRRYWGKSPFRMSRRYLQDQGEDEIHTYGETPLRTLVDLTERCRLGLGETIFELGCGRGRGCFWWRAVLCCRVVGVEFVPEFVSIANEVVEKLEWDGIEFRKEDFRETCLKEATFVYLTGTCFREETLKVLGDRLQSLPSGARVLSVSAPVQAEGILEEVDSFPVRFHWGITEAYLQKRI